MHFSPSASYQQSRPRNACSSWNTHFSESLIYGVFFRIFSIFPNFARKKFGILDPRIPLFSNYGWQELIIGVIGSCDWQHTQCQWWRRWGWGCWKSASWKLLYMNQQCIPVKIQARSDDLGTKRRILYIPHICHFFTLAYFKPSKFYTQKRVKFRQKLPHDKTA